MIITKEIPTTVEVDEKIICDLCSKEGKYGHWETSSFEVENVRIYYRTGSAYPEGGMGTEINVDLCPECFKTKLIPWLREQECDIREEEWCTY